MNPKLAALFQELETFRQVNDARETESARRMLNITHDTGELLVLLARAVDARRILELGTSNGYSTLWLAYAVQPMEGRVITVERSPYKAELARENFKRASLEAWIDLHLGDAGDFLKQQADQSFGLVFLDCERKRYVEWWSDLRRVLVPGGLLIADNAVSHAHEIEPFKQIVQRTPGYFVSIVPVGNGELVVLKEAY